MLTPGPPGKNEDVLGKGKHSEKGGHLELVAWFSIPTTPIMVSRSLIEYPDGLLFVS